MSATKNTPIKGLKIGFANKYFTLWIISEPYRVYTSKESFYWRTDYTFIKNLSLDKDRAVKKAIEYNRGHEVSIDMDLRGKGSFWTSSNSEKAPEDLTVFKFGKYRGKKFTEVDDVNYISWYIEQISDLTPEGTILQNDVNYKPYMICKRILEKAGYVYENYRWISPEWQKSKKEEEAMNGHHFENGARVDLTVTILRIYSYEGYDQYTGRDFWTTILTCKTDDDKIVKYVGGSPFCGDGSEGETFKIKATIKHTTYKDKNETRIQRVKVIGNN